MGVIDPNSVPTVTFEWGAIKWLITPDTVGSMLSFGESVLQPGKGHGRHNHPKSEEVLYIRSGEGMQMLDDGEPFPVKAGDLIYVPTGVYHSTYSASWEPLRVLAIHNPGGAEKDLKSVAGFREVAPGRFPSWLRDE